VTPPSKWDLDCLRAVIEQLKLDALWAGRYWGPFSIEAYDRRHEQHGRQCRRQDGNPHPEKTMTIPFRCITYERNIRQVTALERILAWEQGWKDCPSTPENRR